MKKRCSNCGYRGTLDGIQCCDYILVEKHMRPCPGGDGCAAWKPPEEVNKRARLVREEMERIVPTRNEALKTAEFRKKAKEKLTEEQRRERARERDRKYKAAHKDDPEYKKKIAERTRTTRFIWKKQGCASGNTGRSIWKRSGQRTGNGGGRRRRKVKRCGT